MMTKSDDNYTQAIRELLASDEYQDIGDRQAQAEEALREMRRYVAADPRRARHVKLAVAERYVSLLAAKRRAISDAVMARHGETEVRETCEVCGHVGSDVVGVWDFEGVTRKMCPAHAAPYLDA